MRLLRHPTVWNNPLHSTRSFGQGIARNASTNRTAIDLPLGIDFEIIEDDKKVRILRVWPVE